MKRYKLKSNGQWHLYFADEGEAATDAVLLTDVEIARIDSGTPWQFDAAGEVGEAVYEITSAWVRAEAARRLQALVEGYTTQERETWATQVEEARDIKRDATASAPLLEARAAARGISVSDMSARVLELHQQYRHASATILAAQDRLSALAPIPADYTDDKYWS